MAETGACPGLQHCFVGHETSWNITMSMETAADAELDTSQSLIGHWEVNAKTGELYWSDQVYTIHGLEPGGKVDVEAAINAYHPDDREKVAEYVRLALEEKQDFQFDLRLVRPEGEIRNVRATGVVRTDQDDNVAAVFGIFQDITDIKASEVRLQESAANLAHAQRLAHIGSWTLDLGSKVEIWSDEHFRIFGYEPGQVAPSLDLVISLIHPDDQEEFINVIQKTRSSGHAAYTHEYRIIRPDGSERYIFSSVDVERDDDGNPLRMSGSAQDITDKKLAEQALAASEENYRALFNNANAGIGRIGIEDGKVLLANQTLAKMFGFEDIETFVSEYSFVENYVDPSQRHELITRSRENPNQTTETEFRKRDGSIITVLAHDRANVEAGWFDFVVTDITEQKQTKEALREARDRLEEIVVEKTRKLRTSEERFRDFAQSASDWLWETDTNHRIVWESEGVDDITGLGFLQVKDSARWELPGPHQGDGIFWQPLKSMMDTHQSFKNFEFPYFTRLGALGHVRISGVPVYTERGTFSGYRGAGTDISHSVADQKMLADHADKLHHAVALAKVGYYVWDEIEIRMESCTKEFADIFAMTPDEFLACTTSMAAMVEHVHPDDRYYYTNSVAQAYADGGGYALEYRILDRNGRAHDIQEISTFIYDDAGKLLQTVGALQDISDRKQSERLKSEFISTVSHELRTPLTSIKGSLNLIASGTLGSLPPQIADLVDIANENSERLVKLVNDILDIEKLESGEMIVQARPLDIVTLLDDAIEANTGFGSEHGVMFTRTSAAQSLVVNADSDRLMQVMANLMSNAAKFSPEGSEIELSATSGDTMHRITVRDSGPGIPNELRDSIFEKFVQIDASDTRHHNGTGLGLSIAKAIVEKHGGTIGVESELGAGSTFFVELPASN